MRRSTTSSGDRARFSSLLSRAQKGEPAAVAELYERHARHVMAVVRRDLSPLLRAKYDTMDLAQSVFVEVIRQLPKLHDHGERAFARLLAIKAQNKVKLKLRRHLGPGGRRAEMPLPADSNAALGRSAISSPGGDAEDREKLKRVLGNLDATTREVLRLHSEGSTFVQIADALALASPAAARKRHARALAVLRTRWDRPESPPRDTP